MSAVQPRAAVNLAAGNVAEVPILLQKYFERSGQQC
jgi:hypothetical protein